MEEINSNLREELTKILEEIEDVQKFVTKTITLLQENGKIDANLTVEQIEELCLGIMMQMFDLNKDRKTEG